MATPNSTTDGDAPKNNLEQITFRFCSECSNMLYPKEDEDAHKLQFTCRTCQYTEEATSSCVFRHVMNSAAGETAGVTQDVGSDPTVRNPVPSSSSDPVALASADNSLALCLRCGVTLLHCDRCKDPASVEEYNHYVINHPDFVVTRSLDYIRLTSHWNALDAEGKAAWDDRFASCGGLNLSHLSQDGITQYLPFEIALNPNADPPEALELDVDDYYDTPDILA
ncbi:hypothetical protein F4809DRAFT_41480 [Biscogniauxia mediterranea]|nr:hypothetical protein F4809DRAFT_41480 [Biscogniauxia mediterranea]